MTPFAHCGALPLQGREDAAVVPSSCGEYCDRDAQHRKSDLRSEWAGPQLRLEISVKEYRSMSSTKRILTIIKERRDAIIKLWDGAYRNYPRAITISIILATGCLCVAAGSIRFSQNLWNAAAILVISTLGFHAVALLTFRCTVCWRAVDYPWTLAAVTSIVIALTAIHESERTSRYEAQLQVHTSNFRNLIYSVKSTLTNDCNPPPGRELYWKPTAEPIANECGRLAHLLPQLEVIEKEEPEKKKFYESEGSARNFLIYEDKAQGSWAGLQNAANQLRESSHRMQAIWRELENSPASFSAWANPSSFKLWYLVLAYILGLRLAKITAEIKMARSART